MTWFVKPQRLWWLVVYGGGALISLSDLGDREMRYAKSGNWWEQNVQRGSQTTPSIIKKNQTLELSCESGYPFMIPNRVNEVSTIVCLPNKQPKN